MRRTYPVRRFRIVRHWHYVEPGAFHRLSTQLRVSYYNSPRGTWSMRRFDARR